MNKYYEARGWVKFGEEDIYQEGCQPSTSFGDSGKDIFRAETLAGVIRECQSFCGSSSKYDLMLDSCDETGRLDISIMENECGYPASKEELKQWRKGKVKCFNCIYTFRIKLMTVEEVSLTF